MQIKENYWNNILQGTTLKNKISLTLTEIKGIAFQTKEKTSLKNLEVLNIISEHLICNKYNTLRGLAKKNNNTIEVNERVILSIKNRTAQANGDLSVLLESILTLLLEKQTKHLLSANKVITVNRLNEEVLKNQISISTKDQKILDIIVSSLNNKNLNSEFIRRTYNKYSSEELSLDGLTKTLLKYLEICKSILKINQNIELRDNSISELDKALQVLINSLRKLGSVDENKFRKVSIKEIL